MDIAPYLQLGATALLFGWFIYEYFNSPKKKEDNGIIKALSKIGENDLVHIFGEVQKQSEMMKRSLDQHDRQIELLTEIKTILNERK